MESESVGDLVTLKIRRSDLYFAMKSASELMEKGEYSLNHDYRLLPFPAQATYLERRKEETFAYQRLFNVFIEAYEQKFDPSMIADAVDVQTSDIAEHDMTELDPAGSE